MQVNQHDCAMSGNTVRMLKARAGVKRFEETAS